MKDRVAFNITFYEKYDQLRILVEILRQEFGEDVFINVMCNDMERPPVSLERLDIDNYKIQTRFTLDTSKVDAYADERKRKIINLRMIDQFTTGVRTCADESDADYTLNLHADAWPLSRDGVKSILDEMDQRNRPFGSRGHGWGYTNDDSPYGFVHDLFFFAHNETIRETNVFEFDPKKLVLTNPNIHGTPAAMIHFRYGADAIHWYSDLTNTVGWDGQPKRNVLGAMIPLIHEPELGFLHFNTNYFLEDYGHRFMSNYLQRYGFTAGTAIAEHFEEYPPSDGLADEYERVLSNHPILKRKQRVVRHEINPNEYPDCISTPAGIKHWLKSLVKQSTIIRNGYQFFKSGYQSVPAGPDYGDLLQQNYHDNMSFFAEIAQQIDEEPPLNGVLELETEQLDGSPYHIFKTKSSTEARPENKGSE